MSSSKEERSGHGRKRPASRIISEDNLALIQVGFDHMDEGISMYDNELRLIAWNNAFAELVEFPDDLLQVGRPIAELIRFNLKRDTYGKGDPEEILSSRLALLAKRERQTFDRARSDGRVVEINWFPLPDGGLVITYRDVTERHHAREEGKRAEEELRQSRQRLDDALKQAKMGSVEIDFVSGEINHSESFWRLFGRDSENVDPGFARFLECVHPDDRGIVIATFEKARVGGDGREDEFRIHLPSGEVRHIHQVVKVAADESGKTTKISGTLQDITARKRAEEELRNSEEQLRLVTDGLPVLIAYFDSELYCRFANKTYLSWHRRSQEETLGKPLEDLVTKDMLGSIKPRIERVLTGEPQFFDFEASYPDGKTRQLEASYIPHLEADGKAHGAFILAIDVTDRKAAQEQLRQAQKMEAVGQLTGGVAHEFNNLLMVILGNIEILESRLTKDDPLQLFLSTAMKSARRGAELTQSLLAFSRKQKLEVGQTDLNGLVLGMQNLFQRTLGETIIIETDLAEDLWRTSADAGQIEASLLNFLLNARDAMPDGGTITLRTSNRVMTTDTVAHYDCVEPGDYVKLEVSDTGTGMTEEQVERAFEPFYTTKEVGEGTGLGLSVAFGFTKQSGGCLEIESQPGQGTKVRLSLPRATEAEAVADREREISTEAATGSGKILVVEDDADVRAFVVGRLLEFGYDVLDAADGPAALTLLKKCPEIDLLFSDVVLPGGMSGPEAAEQARQIRPHLKILFTSGYPEKDVEDLAVGSQEVPILRKPYRKSELAEVIAIAMKSQ